MPYPGRVYALFTHPGEDAQLVAFDEGWRERWRRPVSVPLRFGSPIIQASQRHGLSCLEQGAIVTLDPEGRPLSRIEVPCEAQEQVGALLPLEDGFLVSLCQTRQEPSGAAVIRLGTDARLRWRTEIPTVPLAYSGVVTVRAGEGGKARPSDAWKPSHWIHASPTPLLLSGNRLLASFADMPSTGIGIGYVLDVESGALRWSTQPHPPGKVAAMGEGSFLIGAQGYGAFRTTLHDPEGQVVRTWPSHGSMVVLPDGRVRVIELENVLPSRSHVSTLLPDGTVLRGGLLPGYYTSEVAALPDGTLVFWRDGTLFSADAEGVLQPHAEVNPSEQSWAELAWDGEHGLTVAATRTLLTDRGYSEHSSLVWFQLEAG
jgi:outer membrane protein assembly factor BamB